MNMQKGEGIRLDIEDKNTLIFRRVVQLKNARLKNLPDASGANMRRFTPQR